MGVTSSDPTGEAGLLPWLPALKRKLDAEAAATRFAGSVLVAKGETMLFGDSFGWADRERMVPNQVSTRFRIGSINKIFTAVAVCQLVQAGTVDLAAPIGTYLPGYPNHDFAAVVTVHQLLTHTAGTGDVFVPEYDARRNEIRTIADYLDLLGHREPEFEPGSRFGYSNFGYIVLGAVIESVTGRSYYDYVDEHVFAAAGMSRTGALPEDEVSDLAVGYTAEVDGSEVNTSVLPYRGTPAGGGYTTVVDLWRFAVALTAYRLLDASHTALVSSGHVEAGWGGRCVAYGFFERMIYGIRSFGAGGGAPGMSADLAIYPDSGYVVAVLANMDPHIAQDVLSYICLQLPVARAAMTG